MKLNPKKFFRIAFPLILIGFTGFLLDTVYEVISGRGHEYYISGVGHRLTPSGVLVLLSVIPFVLLIGWYARYRADKEEKDFEKKYGSKRKKR